MKIRGALYAALVVMAAGPAPAASADEHSLRNAATKYMSSVTFSSGRRLPYYTTHSVNSEHPGIETVLIVIPGGETNGPKYFQAALQMTTGTGRLGNTAVMALQFQTAEQNPRPGELYWTGEWQQGADSLDGSATSAFSVLDEVLELAVRNFPNASGIYLTGHSSGGQIINRYVAVGDSIADNDRLTFVVMNPSTYVYVDDRRVRPDGSYARPPDADAQCPGFNRWKYGLEDPKPYVSRVPVGEIRERMFRRNVVFMPGLDDTAPKGVDVRCPALYQGMTRIERTRVYWAYIQTFPRWRRNVRLIEVPGVGHAGDDMTRSPQLRRLVFGGAGD